MLGQNGVEVKDGWEVELGLVSFWKTPINSERLENVLSKTSEEEASKCRGQIDREESQPKKVKGKKEQRRQKQNRKREQQSFPKETDQEVSGI